MGGGPVDPGVCGLSETRSGWVEEERWGEEVEAVNTDNPVVKFGCEEKEGNKTVSGGRYVH